MKEAEMGIPHWFMCPISLDLFTDPVTLSTGQTYDRSSIQKWLSAGNQTCPVTMQRLHDPPCMVPNLTLRHLIDQWRLKTGPQSNPNRRVGSESDHSINIDALKHILENSHESNLETKLQTLETIQVLSQDLPSRNSYLVQLGFFPVLLGLVFGDKVSRENQFSRENLLFVEQALVCALKLLPYCSLSPLKDMFKEGCDEFECFLVLLDQGTISIKKSLCEIVEAISSSLEIKELCAMFGKNPRFLQGIVHLLVDASESAIKALFALGALESNRENLVREGAVDRLITCIMGGGGVKAMAMLELLLGVESAKGAVLNHPRGVDELVKMVFRVSDHEGSESAVNALMMLCCDSVKAREGAICAGVLTQLLLLLQSQCGGATKTKARMLLKLLRS